MSKKVKTLSLKDVLQMFSTETKAVRWLEATLWGAKPVCPHCGGMDSIKVYKGKKYTYFHNDCRKAFTVKTNSIMHGSKVSYQNWAITMYLVLTARKGLSSLQLSKELGVTQKTAWFISQRVRQACNQAGDKLSGEIDEAYIGGKESNKHKCEADTIDRMSALARGMPGKRLTYKELVQ